MTQCDNCRWNGFCAHQHYQGNPGCDCAMFQSVDEHISLIASGRKPTKEERKAWQESFVVDKVDEIKKMNTELLAQWKKALKELEKYKNKLQEVQNEAAFNAACADETSDDCDAALIMKDAEIDELKRQNKDLRQKLNNIKSTVRTDNSETLHNALAEIERLRGELTAIATYSEFCDDNRVHHIHRMAQDALNKRDSQNDDSRHRCHCGMSSPEGCQYHCDGYCTVCTLCSNPPQYQRCEFKSNLPMYKRCSDVR